MIHPIVVGGGMGEPNISNQPCMNIGVCLWGTHVLVIMFMHVQSVQLRKEAIVVGSLLILTMYVPRLHI